MVFLLDADSRGQVDGSYRVQFGSLAGQLQVAVKHVTGKPCQRKRFVTNDTPPSWGCGIGEPPFDKGMPPCKYTAPLEGFRLWRPLIFQGYSSYNLRHPILCFLYIYIYVFN